MALVRHLPAVCWVFALAVGACQAWAWRDWMPIDGVCYLDIADAFRGGVWKDTVNGVWSPLYPAVLAAGLAVFEFLPISEFQAVHAINAAILAAALASHEFLLRQAFAAQAGIHAKFGTEPLPCWIWFGTARVLFVWASATMLSTSLVTPDLCAAAVLFLTIGLLFRLVGGVGSTGAAALFGAALGAGYLAKAILFPLAFLFLGMLWAARRKSANGPRQLGTAAAAFALVAGPYVTALSVSKGRLTFSDAGKLNYAWHVNGLPRIHWQGGPEGNGTPVHPTRRIFDSPAIHEFDGPVGGTLPAWYDPSYWFEGVRLRFNIPDQIAVMAENLRFYWRIFAVSLGGFIVLLAASLLLADRRESVPRLLAAQWILLIPAAAALAAYGLVHVEGRYIGPFAVLFGVASLNTLAMPRGARARRLLASLAAGWLAVLTAKAAYSGFGGPPAVVERLVRLAPEVAAELTKQGVRRGDRIATFSGSTGPWDRLLGVRVAAHAEWWLDGVEEQFWALDPGSRAAIYQRLADLGIKGAVLEARQRAIAEPGWRPLGNTRHYWRPLPAAGPRQASGRPHGAE